MSHLEDGSYKDLNFNNISNDNKGEHFLFDVFVFDMPIVFENVVYVQYDLNVSYFKWLSICE
jgi:hypothetical protein